MPWPTDVPHPHVSIVLPAQRRRGELLESLACWASQDYPRDKLEFVIAATGHEPHSDAQVEAFFAEPGAPRGGLAYIKTDNQIAQYAYAERYAHGEWLVFTEPHCLPQRDCLRELIGNLIERDFVGGCGSILADQSAAHFARVQARLDDDELPARSQASDWRKFTKCCFALRRAVYRAIGGFEDHYGSFSELIMAARLDADGHRIGCVPTARVQHRNALSVQEKFDHVWECRQEMARYLDVGSEVLAPYFAEMSTRSKATPACVRQAQQRAVRSALQRGLRQAHTSAGRRMSAAMFVALCESQGGPRLKSACGYWFERMRLACLSWTQEQTSRNFAAAATRLGEWAEAAYRSAADGRFAQRDSVAECADIFPGEQSEGLFGFHPPERRAGRMFRWTSPVASLVLQTPANDGEIAFDLGDFQWHGEQLQAYWNGRQMQRRSGGATFAIERCAFVEQAPQVLTLICPPLAKNDAHETRRLGLPLYGVHLSARKSGALRRAA